KKGCAMWDGARAHGEVGFRVFGTIPVCVRVQEKAAVKDEFLAGKVV
nr:hypothetical protein [Tanacetum cinerariifolium]